MGFSSDVPSAYLGPSQRQLGFTKASFVDLCRRWVGKGCLVDCGISRVREVHTVALIRLAKLAPWPLLHYELLIAAIWAAQRDQILRLSI